MAPLHTVMHVDDEPDIREIAKMSLEIVGGFEVIQCSGGAEAVRKAAEQAPDLILLDVMMPELDGVETYRRLRELKNLANTKIVFMTAKVSRSDHERLRSLGADDVLVKPFDPMLLPTQVSDIWSGNSAVAE